jgi:hypothetical protein
MEMTLKLHGLQHWDAVLALLAVILTAYMGKKVMTSRIKLLLRPAARMLQLPIALRFPTQCGVAQILTPIKPLPRICVLAKLLHAAQNL